MRSASREWFQQDKAPNLDAQQEAILENIVNFVVGGKLARSWVVGGAREIWLAQGRSGDGEGVDRVRLAVGTATSTAASSSFLLGAGELVLRVGTRMTATR